MGGDPEEATRVTPFTELIPYYPLERIYLETDEKAEWDNVAMRVVDLVSPVRFGQRGLIVALQNGKDCFCNRVLPELSGLIIRKHT